MPSKSEKRMRSRSPSRKSKSRSRSRGRSKSPSRAAKSKSKSSPSPSPARKSSSSHKRATPRQSTSPSRQSARIAALELQREEEERAQEKKVNEVVQQKKETPRKRSASRGRQMALLGKVKDVLVGPVLTLVGIACLPLFIVALNAACKKAKCTVKELPRISTDYRTYFNPEVVGVFLAFVAAQALISQAPIGRTINVPTAKGRKLKYRGNALFAFLVTLLWFAIMAYRDLPVTYAARHFTELLGTCIAFGFLFSVLLYIKGRKAPPSERYEPGNTGNILTDFFNGREVNPRIGTFHFKLFCTMNLTMLMWVLLEWSYLWDDFRRNGAVNIPAAIVGGAHFVYVFTFAVMEEMTVTTVKEVFEGCGYYAVVGPLVGPFMHAITIRFLVQHPQTWSNWQLGAFGFAIVLGYLTMWGALLQKAQFRKNPHDPSLAHLDRIPTPNGKGLLVGGWWGICRRPNYLGDLIMWWTFAVMCGFEHAIPFVVPVFTTLFLVARLIEDERECRKKHGGAWDRYCQRVRSRLIPKVF